jgi:hypothetical protein
LPAVADPPTNDSRLGTTRQFSEFHGCQWRMGLGVGRGRDFGHTPQESAFGISIDAGDVAVPSAYGPRLWPLTHGRRSSGTVATEKRSCLQKWLRHIWLWRIARILHGKGRDGSTRHVHVPPIGGSEISVSPAAGQCHDNLSLRMEVMSDGDSSCGVPRQRRITAAVRGALPMPTEGCARVIKVAMCGLRLTIHFQ